MMCFLVTKVLEINNFLYPFTVISFYGGALGPSGDKIESSICFNGISHHFVSIFENVEVLEAIATLD